MKQDLRVAYFPDSFLEVNGVAMTSNKFINYVRRNENPFLVVHAASKTETVVDGSITFVRLRRSLTSFTMDEGLKYDPLFQRHTRRVRRALEEFKPDVFHITGLNDVSIMGAYLAWKMDVPMVGSWHTNLHEYAARRLRTRLGFIPAAQRFAFTNFIERKILDGAKLYYRMPQVLLAPNDELVEMLETGTGRKARLMIRGVNTEIFSPEKKTAGPGIVRLGFVGRLRVEKNVRLLVDLERALIAAGKKDFRFLIVGEGNEREYLEKSMKNVDFTGFLEGEKLSEAYANMDIFVFPSDTDAFGNVVQEANASGVPCIVSDQGGPKFIVREGETGYVAATLDDFVKYSIELLDNPEKLSKMKTASREFALSRSWESVFDSVYDAYREARSTLAENRRRKAEKLKEVAETPDD
ncbi:MAG TPA: glycosyltransferase [Pyrinomonadaceae bacterium]|nr:glycosyltransferase [Pyrinomonadaceae bacterium]